MLKNVFYISLMLFMEQVMAQSESVRIATFNVSMEATNYVGESAQINGDELFNQLATGKNSQIKNIATIIQTTRPDIILLNEFDFNPDLKLGVLAFIKNYLNHSDGQTKPIDYPYFYVAAVNTGVDSGLDLDNDGVASGKGGDAFGFGLYPGQYGMALLSRYPIDSNNIRTFQHFLWKDMPNNLMTSIKNSEGQDWYHADAQNILRLSSKSHWDVPVLVNGKSLHILASHPTPPVFDGPENRNGKRNHDEVRFWNDYISTNATSDYIYDDKGQRGGINQSSRFVILGDLNSSADEGDSLKEAISTLVTSDKVMQYKPTSAGAKQHTPGNAFASSHTAQWRMRADYVIPSRLGLSLIDSGVFWPAASHRLAPLVATRETSSDHRLVWVDVKLTD